MKRLLLRLAVTTLTFSIGLGVTTLARRLTNDRTRPFENVHLESGIKAAQSGSEFIEPDDYPVEGRYANFDYAYSVLVPRGMMAAMNSYPPAPNHGFGIDLTQATSISWVRERQYPRAFLWADASYDSAETGTPDNQIKQSLKWLREKHPRARLLSKTATRLGQLRAVRFVIAYEESGEAMVEDQIVAFRSQLEDDSDIIYSIHLTTPVARYDQDKQRLVEMQKSWIIDPLPNDYPLPPVYEISK